MGNWRWPRSFQSLKMNHLIWGGKGVAIYSHLVVKLVESVKSMMLWSFPTQLRSWVFSNLNRKSIKKYIFNSSHFRTHLRTCGASSFRESAPWPLRHFFLGTLPETNSSHLKMDGWNTIVPFCVSAHFQGGTVSLREWTPPKTNMTMENPPFEHGDFPLSC